jgi:glycosyltransferase involved in cell wall biosynthesis
MLFYLLEECREYDAEFTCQAMPCLILCIKINTAGFIRMRSGWFSQRLTSLIWRALTRYGRIKYRYLLPFYKALRLAPGSAGAASRKDSSLTLRGAEAVSNFLSRSNGEASQRQLKEIIKRVEASKGAIIFLPSIGWNITSAQRPHHLAREFARQGYLAIFDCSNQYDDVNGFKEISPDLFLFRGSESLLSEIPDPILWAFTYNYDHIDSYPRSTRTVYDWIDDFDVFPFDRTFLEENHARALKEATVVASVAQRLHNTMLSRRPDALYLPNAVEYWRFADSSPDLPRDKDIEDFLRDGKPIAGYYGSMAEWLDYEMLGEVARLRTDWNFLLIGQMYDDSIRERARSTIRRPNVRWIGHREYETLPSYLRLFDVATIPFLINDITLATSPLKLYEYFAGGKPVITTRMPECESFAEVRTVANALEFSEALDIARSEGTDPAFRERLLQLARNNSWTARVQSVIEQLDRCGGRGKGSISPSDSSQQYSTGDRI